MTSEQLLREINPQSRFPRSAAYDLVETLKLSMGPNVLWQTEWLTQAMQLRPGMRVLDMGCGKALSSIFLAREFDVIVYATDLWISAAENQQRIREAGLEGKIVPIHAEAHALPYADGFFDAAVSIDSYQYYGTDDLYLGTVFAKLVRPGGQIGIVVPALMQEIEGDEGPEHLVRHKFWSPAECWSFHTREWWRRHWSRSKAVRVDSADVMEDGWKLWLAGEKLKAERDLFRFPVELPAIEEDAGRYMGFVRLVGTRPAVD